MRRARKELIRQMQAVNMESYRSHSTKLDHTQLCFDATNLDGVPRAIYSVAGVGHPQSPKNWNHVVLCSTVVVYRSRKTPTSRTHTRHVFHPGRKVYNLVEPTTPYIFLGALQSIHSSSNANAPTISSGDPFVKARLDSCLSPVAVVMDVNGHEHFLPMVHASLLNEARDACQPYKGEVEAADALMRAYTAWIKRFPVPLPVRVVRYSGVDMLPTWDINWMSKVGSIAAPPATVAGSPAVTSPVVTSPAADATAAAS